MLLLIDLIRGPDALRVKGATLDQEWDDAVFLFEGGGWRFNDVIDLRLSGP
jgi:hypothetical protein